MTRRRAPWLAALLPLLATGAAWAAEAPPPSAQAAEAMTLAEARVAIAALFEKAIEDCARTSGGMPVEGQVTVRKGEDVTFPHVSKRADVNYPSIEEAMGSQAILVIAALIDSLGNPRYAHVAREVSSAVMGSPFGRMAVAGIRRTTFMPGTRNGEPVANWWHGKLKFIVAQEGRMGNILSESKLNEFVQKARAGDGKSQAVIAYLDSIAHEEVGIPDRDRNHFLAVSAANGERNALLTVTRMLGAPGCRPPADVDALLRKYAMSGRSDLELLHATRMLDRGTVDGHPEVSPMLHGAANSNDPFVQLWAAGILATAPIDSVRDAPAALESALTLKVEGDPDAGETLAAALAANGRHDDAVKAEVAAIAAATKLHWNVALMQKRLARYQAGEPWVGWLCDCDRLVPDGGQ
jgi:hypothetical protein